MRRIILGGLVAATLGVPALSFAEPATGVNTRFMSQPTPQSSLRNTEVLIDRQPRPHDMPANGVSVDSLGGGMEAGNDPGHVTGPGNAPIDNSTRGPINDVQPGQGSADTRQARNPKPVY